MQSFNHLPPPPILCNTLQYTLYLGTNPLLIWYTTPFLTIDSNYSGFNNFHSRYNPLLFQCTIHILKCAPLDLRYKPNLLKYIYLVLRIRIRICWIRKILASWIRIRKNMRIHGSGSKGHNINQKLQQKKNFTLKSQV